MPSQMTKSGQRTRSKPPQKKLSDTARHICRPSGIVSTAWSGVKDRAGTFGIGFDRWQDGLGRLTLAKRADGLYAAGVGGVVASIPRQTGKTFLYGWMVFALCTIQAGMTVIWTAHRTRTSDETFEKMRSMAMKPKVAPYIENARSANGQQEIAFKNGSRILFGAREQGFGRGFDEIDILVLDEAQILTESAMSDMVPATNAAANGLVIMMGTPPRPKDPGEVFGARRADALSGDEDTLYVEFSADEGAKIIDWDQLAKANPSFPHRTSRTAILRMQKLLGSDDNFAREAYGQWDDMDGSAAAISKPQWSALVDAAPPADDAVLAFGVKFTADGSGVALAAAYRPDEGPVYVEPLQQSEMSQGLDWLVDHLAEHKSEAAQIVIDGKAGVGYLVDALREAGVKNKRLLLTPTLNDVVSAHSMFLQAVITGGLSHPGVEAFDDQVLGAQKRKIGNNGGFGWEPLVDGETVVTLDAATLAYWGAKTTKRRPGRLTRGVTMQ